MNIECVYAFIVIHDHTSKYATDVYDPNRTTPLTAVVLKHDFFVNSRLQYNNIYTPYISNSKYG